MKTNLLFFFAGVVSTIFIMLLFFDRPLEQKVLEAEQLSAESVTSESIFNEPTASLETEPAPNAADSSEGESDQWPVFDPTHDEQLIDYMVAHQVESVMTDFSPVVSGDQVKLKMLAELAGDMMRKDSETAVALTDDTNIHFDYTILDRDDANLSPEELDEKKKVREHWNRLSETREQHRIEYEDAIRNLLTPDELQRYQETEQLKAHQQLLAQARYLAKETKVSLRDLSDYQRSELNRIANQIAQEGSSSIPIGYSLGGGNRNLSTDMAKMTQAFQKELDKLLTDEQIATLEKSHIMLY